MYSTSQQQRNSQKRMSLHRIIISCIFFIISAEAQQCHENQKASLLKFKIQSFVDSSLQTWKINTDCCSWSGVTCSDSTGHVIGLDLTDSILQGSFYSNSSLFHLTTLQYLYFSYNYLPGQYLIPSAFEKLSNLTHLSLRYSGFSGKVPLQLSRLTRLISLDLSDNIGLHFEDAHDLEIVIQNMTQLKELRLDGVKMPSISWSTPLSIIAPYLNTLALSNCSISGELLFSLSNLPYISSIDLSRNNLSTHVLELFGGLSSLKSLVLSDCDLRGEIPESILKHPYLENLDLSYNQNLQGSLLHLPKNIQLLSLSHTNFHGNLPESVGNLQYLTQLLLNNCNFSGEVPSGIRKLSKLSGLDLSSNNFHGPIPSFENCFNKLMYLNMDDNLFDGEVHHSLFTLPSLQILNLRHNRFIGLPSEFRRNLTTSLIRLDLSENFLQGSVPDFIFQLTSLFELYLSSNNLSGILDMDRFGNLKSLINLYLSENPFSIKSSPNIIFKNLHGLQLRSCGLSQIPHFVQNLEQLIYLDLSNNKIDGQIPNWIWFPYLNLSHNLLTGINHPLLDVPLISLDLSSNNLNGPIPFALNLINATFFSVSRNRLTGKIPQSICSFKILQILDLSNNKLSGEVPACVGKFSRELVVLNLGGNGFSGEIPLTYSHSLRSIVFNGNMLNGTVPRSLSNCTFLEVLDLGNNQMSDIFPFWLETLPNLRVLILRSNSFNGHIEYGQTEAPFPKLHVIDISSNRFAGHFPSEYFRKWKGMSEIQLDSTQVKYLQIGEYYHDSVTITMKGYDMVLSRILTIFSSFDVSNNSLEGVIGDFGELKSLIVLNLSHNSLVGSIPSSFEKLSQLESLDLSKNKLSGEIPQALTSLTFLAVLDLSGNRLEGTIPRGRQFNTFPISCYEGNDRLCGFPLNRKCKGYKSGDTHSLSNQENEQWGPESAWDWKFALMGYGSGLVAGLSTGYVFVLRNNRFITNAAKWKRKSRFERR